MKPLIFMLLFISSLFADVTNQYPDAKLLQSGMPIIDIRTPGEWKQTGLLKGSIPIMFFDERGSYDLKAFMAKLQKHVSKDRPFALICRTGSRTRTVSNYLGNELGYKVINLQGGILYAIGSKLPVKPYQAK